MSSRTSISGSRLLQYDWNLSVMPRSLRLSLCYLAFLVANVYDMGGEHGYKYWGFVLLVPCVLIGLRKLRLRPTEIVFFVAVFALWPALSLLNGLMHGADLSIALSQSTPFVGVFFALASAPLIGADTVLRLFYTVIFSAVLLVLVITVLLYFGYAEAFIGNLPTYISCHVDPYQGARQFFVTSVRVYLTATLWFVPAAVYYAWTKKPVRSALCLVALVFSISKSGALIASFFIVAGIVAKKRRLVWNLSIVVGGMIAALAMFPDFGLDVYNAFMGEESSTRDVRVGHARSYFDMITLDPIILLSGQGAGSEFRSLGTGMMEVRMETDHLDAMRQHGLPWFAAFSGLCAVSAMGLVRSSLTERKAVGWALISMYFAAGTNPQLITPLFLFFLGCCFLLSRGHRSAAVPPHLNVEPPLLQHTI